MRKTFISIFWLFSAIGEASAQIVSPGLDALFLNSDIILQGKVLGKYCDRRGHINNIIRNECVVTLEVGETIKGSPVLSAVAIKQEMMDSLSGVFANIDTLSGVSFIHSRFNFGSPDGSESISYDDYNVKIGDAVIVFLKAGGDSTLYPILKLPQDWVAYSLVDAYLGIITANDWVMEYLLKLKRKKKFSNQ